MLQAAQTHDDYLPYANGGALGEVLAALQSRTEHPSAIVREHVDWALARHAQAGDS